MHNENYSLTTSIYLNVILVSFQSLYNEKLGSGDIVEIVGDSNTVDREKLNPNKVELINSAILRHRWDYK